LLLSSLTHSREDGTALLNLLVEEIPDFAPDFYNNYEPINRPFVSVEETIAAWQQDPFLWKHRRGPKSEGSVFFAKPNRFTNLTITFVAGTAQFSTNKLAWFLRLCAVRFDAVFGYLHLLTGAEHEDIGFEASNKIEVGVFEHALKKGIPSLCWATIWGEPYINLFGASTLDTAPVAVLNRLSDTHFYMQLTDSLFDIRDNHDQFRQCKSAAMDHLGRQFFWGSRPVIVPDFK
jgi:hypothetical protein